ncbi:DUF1659 domain-containing protein [Neofamilia massiliensis]|uniref:DUF1659 domain-containing protein n=1 Tax=Neofamilia massiliensis TaxID=1673724 RepID=UPI0006BB5CD1|nr:DUF1659 domain-containing protein [Neofamilia massiliensis]
MATATITKNQLRLEFDNGTTADGKQKFKAKTFSNVNTSATDDNLLVAARAIDGLTAKELVKTKKVVTSEINE